MKTLNITCYPSDEPGVGMELFTWSYWAKKLKNLFKEMPTNPITDSFEVRVKGASSQDNIARGKADIDAKAQLAGQVNTTMKQVADQYLGQTENEKGADVADKFQSLVRQVMNTNIADLRKMGEEKYFNRKDKRIHGLYRLRNKKECYVALYEETS